MIVGGLAVEIGTGVNLEDEELLVRARYDDSGFFMCRVWQVKAHAIIRWRPSLRAARGVQPGQCCSEQ